jgi:hypothetical protein
VSVSDRRIVWLARGWWLLMPPFALLVARLTVERACAAPYELLPTTTSVPLLAWMLAGLYVGAHAWMAAAYLLTVERTGALIPTISAVRAAWRGQAVKLLLAAAVLATEYAPIPMWRAVGQGLGCQATEAATCADPGPATEDTDEHRQACFRDPAPTAVALPGARHQTDGARPG